MIALGWCRTHINRQINRIRYIFKWAASKELIPGTVHHGLSTVVGLRGGRTNASPWDAPAGWDTFVDGVTFRQIALLAQLNIPGSTATPARVGNHVIKVELLLAAAFDVASLIATPYLTAQRQPLHFPDPQFTSLPLARWRQSFDPPGRARRPAATWK
jgi:hypothetical protein